jgi:hypothetical protein
MHQHVAPEKSLQLPIPLWKGFVEDGVALDGIYKGWPAIPSSLRRLLETGAAPSIRTEPSPMRTLGRRRFSGIPV